MKTISENNSKNKNNNDDCSTGYFYLKNIQGPIYERDDRAIFYDIYLLTDSLPDCETKNYLTQINNTNFNYLEEHLFDEEGVIIGYSNP